MAVPRNSLSGFLVQARGALRAAIDSSQRVTLVLGNESADLDSMSCSILYAYLRSLSPPKNAFSSIYVPVTNLVASDIQLRPEYLAAFRHADIKAEQLITLDDLPELSSIQTRLVPEKTKWILVDHNKMQGPLGKIYSHRVAGVIDHHDDEGSELQEMDDEPRVVEKSGSCTSLVVNYCRPMWDQLSASAMLSGELHAQGDSDAASAKRWDATVAKLGMASILIDTANLKDENKTTEHDRAAVDYLEAKILPCPQLATSFDRDSFYMEIDAAKKDVGAMRLQDILRKDYKQWDQKKMKLGVSSAVKSIEFLQEKAGNEAQGVAPHQALIEAIARFSQERALDLYSLMTTSTSPEGEFQRELLVWAFNDNAVTAAKAFATHSSEELGLVDWDGAGHVADECPGNGQWRKVWWQRQVQHSRKRVAPLLREGMVSGVVGSVLL